jgi:hypothetical protein
MVDEGFICDNASMRASVNIACILNNTNTLALELNSWCILENSKFKHRRSFLMQNLTKNKSRSRREKPQLGCTK